MHNDEYEKRRQALQQQYQEDLELLRAGYQARLRALEALWLSPPEKEGVDARRGEDLQHPQPARPKPPEPGKPARTEAPPPAAPVKPSRPHPRGGLPNLVRKVLPQLSEVFEKRDVVQALGFEPRRTTLVRTLQDMVFNNEIAFDQYGSGRLVTTYRKVPRPT
jgi:hypothetical protein